MSTRSRWLFGQLILLMAAFFVQVTVAANSRGGKITYVSTRPITNPDGAVVYQDYCAVCHGVVGRGDGPAAKYLDTPVPDLTRIAVRDGGFDRYHVMSHVEHSDAPEPTPMPCWQRSMRTPNGNRETARLVMVNLTNYLERLQVRQ